MKQVTDLTIDTEERLKGVIDLVFEKAIDEPSFSVAYGHMCRCLATVRVTDDTCRGSVMGIIGVCERHHFCTRVEHAGIHKFKHS